MSDTPRESQILQAVVSLVDSLLDDFDVVELLTQLTEHCIQLLDVAAAGLLLADSTHQLHLMTATSARTAELELFQLQSDEGPCLDCYAAGTSMSVADLSSEAHRWPRFVAAATEAGFLSVHTVPMRAAGMVLGALGLFGTSIGELGPADLAVGQTLAHIASVAILQEQAPAPEGVMPRLHAALASRVVVEQARGVLRSHLGVSIEDALTLLRSYARSRGEHITEIARRMVADREARASVLTDIAARTRAG